MAIPRLTRYDPDPAEVLTPSELSAAADWRSRWGETVWTREQGMDPRSGHDRALLSIQWVQVPLVEIGGQGCYDRLRFLAWRLQREESRS
jgi:hypothetical protein